MPPIHSESRSNLIEQEGKILLALQSIEKEQFKSIRAAARLFGVPELILRNRARDIQSRVDTRPNGYKLTQLEEDSLTEWILSMDSRGAAPRTSTVREIANILLATRGSHPPAHFCQANQWRPAFCTCTDLVST